MKPGITTSEFWVTVFTNAGILASAFTGVLNPHWAAIASAISVAAYGISRGIAKNATAIAPSKLKSISLK